MHLIWVGPKHWRRHDRTGSILAFGETHEHNIDKYVFEPKLLRKQLVECNQRFETRNVIPTPETTSQLSWYIEGCQCNSFIVHSLNIYKNDQHFYFDPKLLHSWIYIIYIYIYIYIYIEARKVYIYLLLCLFLLKIKRNSFISIYYENKCISLENIHFHKPVTCIGLVLR